MKNGKSVLIIIFIILACNCLTGCESWIDENGNSHFMLFGEHGATKDGEPLSEEEIVAFSEKDSSSEMDSVKDSENLYPENSQDYHIKADSLKQGWTSDDNSILKGTNVSIANEIKLFSITAKEDKEVTFNLDASLKSGSYEIVLVYPDKTELVLYNEDLDNEQKVVLKEGENSVWIRCNEVVFKNINLTIDGLNSSDF